jgi:hypothetical protein
VVQQSGVKIPHFLLVVAAQIAESLFMWQACRHEAVVI